MKKRTTRTAWWLSAMLAVVAVEVLAGSEPSAATDPFSTIAKRGIAATKLDEAVARLQMPPSEPPDYWSRIANDPAYSRFHRRRAVFQLLSRHLQAGMRLSDLAHLVNHPTWLRTSDIHVVEVLHGWIPVELNVKDTVFVIVVLPDAGKDQGGIYLRVAGKVELGQFSGLLLSTEKVSNQTRSANIVEIGLCEDPREKPCEHKGSRT